MQNRRDKFSFIDVVILTVAFIVLVVGLLLPKTGPNVLTDELFEILLWWMLELYVIYKVFAMRQSGSTMRQKARTIIAIIGVLLCLWISRNVVADFFVGTEECIIYDTEVSMYRGYAGIIAVHYYLTGKDETGNNILFEISESDYYQYQYRGAVTIVYYPHTGRVVEYAAVIDIPDDGGNR